MTKKTNINTFGVILWLFLMYIWTYIFLLNTSDNKSVKNFTYIEKALAAFDFYQDKNQNTSYESSSGDLYDWNWASPNYPLQAIYSTWIIINTDNPAPISNSIAPIVNNRIIIPITHSH